MGHDNNLEWKMHSVRMRHWTTRLAKLGCGAPAPGTANDARVRKILAPQKSFRIPPACFTGVTDTQQSRLQYTGFCTYEQSYPCLEGVYMKW